MVFDWSISGDCLGLLHIHLVSLLRLCVDLDYMLVLLHDYPLSCLIVCCLSMWDTHVSPLSPTH